MDVNTLYDWSIPVMAHHNVRVICDQEGLDYGQKQILAACVMQESGFNIHATNKNMGRDSFGHPIILSEDWGIVQINDHWHIGPGKDFPSPQYVIDNPEACVRYMCRYYKSHGDLMAWSSYKFGAYKKFLGKV